MNTMGTRWGALGLGLLLWGGLPARAEPPSEEPGQGGFERPGGGRGEMGERIRRELGLSEEQAKQLRELREAHRQEAMALHQEVQSKREALKAALESPQLDEGRVKSLQADLKAVHEKLADHRLEGILEVRKILTPEQFAKFQEMTRDRPGFRGKEGRSDRAIQRRGGREGRNGAEK